MKTVLDPVPGYVIKTVDLSDNVKVFINVCMDNQVPPPETLDPSEIAVKVTQGQDWVVPIVVSAKREDKDKTGKNCRVYDCCMNPEVTLLGTQDPSVKVLTVESCLEIVEDRDGIQLSREYKFPKMKNKGKLINTEFDPKKPAVTPSPLKTINEHIEPNSTASRLQKFAQPEKKTSTSIEVVESNDESDFYFHVYRGPYSGEGPKPNYAVEIDGMLEDVAINGSKLSAPGKRAVDMGFTPAKIDSFYNEEDGCTYILLWKP